MTPEERAEHFLRTDRSRLREECKANLASAFREAENAAYERAAELCQHVADEAGGDPTRLGEAWEDGRRSAAEECAEAIRSLKSKDTP